MIKRFLFFSITLTVIVFSNLNGQSVNDSVKKEYLPQKGDWAVGIDATPIFQYAGNFFADSGNPYSPTIKFNAQYPNSIFVKVKTGDLTVVRAVVTVGLNHTNDNIINIEDESNPHELLNSALSIGAIFGVERKKSIRNRLLSYYGVEAGVLKSPYVNGSTVGLVEYKDKNDEELYFKEYGGNCLSVLTSLFIGLEYYIFPKFAVSGEIGLDFSRTVQSERYRRRGNDDSEIIDDRKVNYNIKPGTSGNLGVFIYF